MAEALAIREVDLVMVMLMDMVLQVVGQAAMDLRTKAMDHLVVDMVLEEVGIEANSNVKDLVGMTTELRNDRGTRCGRVRYVFLSSCFHRIPRF